jgi:hypothetical protein
MFDQRHVWLSRPIRALILPCHELDPLGRAEEF